MPSARETNTMSEGLMRILNEITKMKAMPDGDLQFPVELETMVLQYLRPVTAQEQTPGGQMGGMQPPMDPMMGAPMDPMMDPMMAMAGPPGLPPGVPANPMMPGGGINPDELRRMLEQ